jgi:hypothetical protein
MYKTKDNSYPIYLIDIVANKQVCIFQSTKDLIKFLVRNQGTQTLHEFYGNKFTFFDNEYLDNINMNTKDTVLHRIPYLCTEKIQRRYMFIDNMDRIIDPRVYVKEIYHINQYLIENFKKPLYRGIFSLINPKHLPKFRKDPIPHTGGHHYKKYHQHSKVYHELKNIANKDFEGYIRPKEIENSYCGWWDEPYRPTNKSWKTNIKAKHQWDKS